ncbi:putative C-S lyase [Superficieibacter electus]|uniref:cysteine-S-conjugate beta-lyase n=1 Tax=Superficieibacter electus TaxID=2022662 RepID=A0A2P5GMU7_9ENTR|nr:PatB family C-S lyase [Superficieibacter electus]POP44680.1 putative C-S lyase [Superficieibacter electus]POP47431.1 putative C-S lyase [Superficieibacter electus]
MSLFDSVVTRDPISRKYGQMKQMFGTEDVLPLWIADMDFRTPAPVLDSLISVSSQPVQGYNMDYPGWKTSVVRWYKKQYNTDVSEEWLHFIPGVIKAVVLSVLALSKPGYNILTCTPIYDPYRNMVSGCGRNLIQSRLIEKNGTFTFDWHDFRSKLKMCRIFLFVSPHNPGGVVWDHDTLSRIKRYCHEEGVIVVSDEVHCDLTLPGKSHTPFFAVDPAQDTAAIVLTSIGKTFNAPGIQGGIMIVKNTVLRDTIFRFLDNCYLAETHYLQQAAIYAAFTQCDDWHQQLLTYLAENVAFVRKSIGEHCPKISVIHGGASYLLFLNAERMGLSDEALAAFFVNNAKLGLSPGLQYGAGGERHMRLNVGCPRAVLAEAMEKLRVAYEAVEGVSRQAD